MPIHTSRNHYIKCNYIIMSMKIRNRTFRITRMMKPCNEAKDGSPADNEGHLSSVGYLGEALAEGR